MSRWQMGRRGLSRHFLTYCTRGYTVPLQYLTPTPTFSFDVSGPAQKAVPVPISDFSDLEQVWAPQLFYTCFYNHARHLRLEKLLHLELPISSSGFLKPLLDPDGGFTSDPDGNGRYTAVSEVKRKKI